MAISYTKTQWTHGKVISATELNNIENGIEALAGGANVSEDHTVTKHLSIATAWSRNAETQAPTVQPNDTIMSADSTGVTINKPTTINGTLTVGSTTTPSTATINGTITGDVVIDGTFKIKNGDNIVLEKNSETPSTIHIPNYLVVGKATTGDNSTINYEGNVTFNTATNYIHGNTRIENLTVDNKISGLTIGNVNSDSITNSGNLISNSITNSGNLTVGTAGTTTVEGAEVPTYTGTATFNTENTIMHGITTIDNCNAAAATVTGTANVNTNLIVGTDATPGAANIKGTLTASGITTLNNNLIVGSNETPRNANIYGDLIVGKATTEEVNGNQTTTYTGATTFNTQTTTIHGTTTIENLIVSNPITHTITASNLTITGNTNSLIVGTAEINNDGNTTPATGQTILHGSTTIDNLTIGTINTLTIGTAAVFDNDNQPVTAPTGSTILHGNATIDDAKIDTLTVGTAREVDPESGEETVPVTGNTVLHGSTIIDNLTIGTLNSEFTFDNDEEPTQTLVLGGERSWFKTLTADELDFYVNISSDPEQPEYESRVHLEASEEPSFIKRLNVETFNGASLPTNDGEYMLKLTITSGQPSYSWVAIGGAEP